MAIMRAAAPEDGFERSGCGVGQGDAQFFEVALFKKLERGAVDVRFKLDPFGVGEVLVFDNEFEAGFVGELRTFEERIAGVFRGPLHECGKRCVIGNGVQDRKQAVVVFLVIEVEDGV